jgi:phenylacetate-CoA ligase
MKKKLFMATYERLPVFLQNVACSLAGLKMRRERYNRTFLNALEFLRKSQWWSLSEQRAYQDEKLKLIIEHAYKTVPYYRETFDAQKLTPNDIKCKEDLNKLPLLDKKTVRKRFADLQSKGWPKRLIRYGHTSGTTGSALKLAMGVETQPWQWAVWWRYRERFGLKLNDPFIVFAGRNVVPLKNLNLPIWRRNITMHQTYLSTHHLSKNNLTAVAKYLCKRRVKYYSGYPSGIYLLACFFLENKIHLSYPPRAVLTGSETLLPHQREIIGKAFDTEVSDQYGTSEQCGNISACEKHSYHVDMEFGIVEFLPMKNMPSNVRRIVCTGFHNLVMPMVRYDIGDIATVNDSICSCGRESTTVEKIDGRIESYILTPDGRQLGRLGFLFYDTHNIKEAQLVQKSLDSLVVRIVPSSKYCSTNENALVEVMKKYLGNRIAINLEYIDTIPREANGKFRHIISDVFRDKYAYGGNADNFQGTIQ